MTEVMIAPEEIEIANLYLTLQSQPHEVASTLGISKDVVMQTVARPHVKRYIDNVFLEQGYLNRGRLMAIMDEIIESKLEEAREDEMYTNADLLDILKFVWKIRTDSEKQQTERDKVGKPSVQVNTQVNNNYQDLLSKLVDNG